MRKMTTADFIRKAREIHGDKYDYSKVVYVKSNLKVVIICPEHGEFLQSPNSHLNGAGCPKCAAENRVNDTESFVKKSRMVHGDRYDYSKTKYVDANTKVVITCPEHGDFEMLPTQHTKGYGCKYCHLYKGMTFEQFVEAARKRHGDKYEYLQETYKSPFQSMKIICPEHGEFSQIPVSHLSGIECKKCRRNI